MIKNIINWFRGTLPKYTDEERKQLSMFGVWQSPAGPRLIMEKQAAGIKACKKCSGFGNYGIPMCGALYRCDKCNGSGKR
jgi:hypothetical protein